MKQRSPLLAPIAIAIAVIGLLAAGSAYAAMPTLSLVSIGGDSVQINVNGDPNAAVMFYYNVASATGMQVTTIGTTNSSGSFSTTISTGSYNINGGNSVYVVVNGQQSTLQAWPYTASGSTPVLSESNVMVGLGQSLTVVSQTNASVYMVSSSNPSVATISTNGTQISVTGEQIGSTSASICYVGTASNCTNLSVTVQQGTVSVLSFSQSNLSLSIGGNQAATIYGGNGVYSLSGNSNPAVVSTSLSGSSLTVYGLTAGSATITVCDQSGNCGPLSVTVGSSSSSGQSVVFGVANPTIAVGQNLNTSLSGGSTYFVSSNANASIVQASVNGGTLSLYGDEVGSDSLTICVSGGGCGTLYVNVTNTGITQTTTNTNSSVLTEIQSLQTTVTQMLTQLQSVESQLTQLEAQVGAGTTSVVSTASPTTSYTFTEFLSIGSQDAEVTALQERLTTLGFYSGPVTGFYGALTETAVKQYQAAHGIEQLGYVGPSTRDALNTGK